MPRKKFIVALGELAVKLMPSYFKPLKEEIKLANLGVLFEVYVGRMVFLTIFSFIAVFIHMFFMLFFFAGFPLWFSLPGALLIAGVVAFAILTVFHSYPYQVISKRKSSIEANLPFALNHMAAVAASGVPPLVIFKLLSGVKEYGEVANEATRIVRNVENFGMDLLSAIRQVADTTPSEKFREFLFTVISTIETGGELKRFLKTATQESLFEYRLRREKYLATLSTYADFYTAVLIAAPLFFISILSVMAMIGGKVMGMDIITLMQLGIYFFIPLLNIAFIAFIHLTQPAI